MMAKQSKKMFAQSVCVCVSMPGWSSWFLYAHAQFHYSDKLYSWLVTEDSQYGALQKEVNNIWEYDGYGNKFCTGVLKF